MDELDAPLSSRLTAPAAALLAKELGLETVRDLLWHLPRRYAERGQLTPIRQLVAGDDVTIVAQVVRAQPPRRMRNRDGALMQVTLGDGRDTVGLTFFARSVRQFAHHERQLREGRTVLASGRVEVFNRSWQLARPDYQPLDDDTEDAAALADRPIPLYPATGKAPSWKIAKAVQTVLGATERVPDVLPAGVVAEAELLDPLRALRAVHAPRDRADVARGQRRLRYEEAFVLQTALAQRRAGAASERAVPRTRRPGGLAATFDTRLPFPLTGAQERVGEEIADDLARERPMQRLLQGDVGSGKTLVALRAMLTVVDGGGQAALLAPTEVLAAQHLRSTTAALGDLAAGGLLGGHELATRVVLLTGSMGAAARREALLAAASGEAGIVIGTHALLEEHVAFADLGLVVVDEQHRFGVEQRDALRAKASSVPHLLVMTATPIPRTVAMTVFGDLETSVLDELPPGRAEVTTVAVPMQNEAWVDRVWRRVAEEAALGRQAYVVCARIDGDDAGKEPDDGGGDEPPPDDGEKRRPPLAVSDVVEIVRHHPATAHLRTEVLHGRMHPADKDDVMRRFSAGEVDVVVSTTVVEVGVDVPNASVMVVVDADRFGVSQLHQLRGRIGRGGLPGTCLLMTEVPEASPAGQRLSALVATRDGFELARLDLEQRREGDVLGAAQSGRRSSLRLLGVLKDADVIADARAAATALVAADPALEHHPALAAAVADRVSGETERFLERA
ncbi:ATP-dependent DNA helicase RecG [Paenibacillus sp. TRM 82003]|uniref:ATP-dependent DNA helicase RecG n=1 Tax=Kineococcus sp. TRM81007 TaxID=2925831 RepID=UPI001F567B58|nr:ATP-dependent DNA helicase RecG [Kineococcus sp. TRM81007]MCI2240205.1 ATP-dependent DNA helicase RecG [Kineococcus sp. TRM81007]MCI3927617.1 ATP-dependent DNA helicase RecG [Paenibacillus sp. TRM 82003]